MTVSELIENLKEMPQDGEIVIGDSGDCIRIVSDNEDKGVVFVE